MPRPQLIVMQPQPRYINQLKMPLSQLAVPGPPGRRQSQLLPQLTVSSLLRRKKTPGRLNQRRLRRILQTTAPRPTPTASHVSLVVMSLPLMPRTWSAALYVWSGSIMSVWERIGDMWVCGPVSPVVVSLLLSWTFKHRLTPLHHR